MRLSIAALAVAVLAGCSDGSFSEQEKGVKAELERYFAELNAEAGARAQSAKATKSDVELSATSLILNRYDWNLGGAVYPNAVCTNASCGAKIGTLYTAGPDVRCPACNTTLTNEFKDAGKGKPMFEVRSGNATPIVVIVRYIRHSYALDPNSAVAVSAKTEATNSIKPYTDTNERGRAYYAGGLYRETGSAVCTTGFVFKGGSLRQIDLGSVKKMTQDPPETVSVSSMKLGRWGAVEDPLVGWLGKPPVGSAAKKEEPKSP